MTVSIPASYAAGASEVILVVGGNELRGWTSVHIVESIDKLSASFKLTVSELDPADPVMRQVRMYDHMAVWLADQLVVAGYVTGVTTGYTGNRYSVEIKGSDYTIDLKQCSAAFSPNTWSNEHADVIGRELVKPYRYVTWLDGDDTGPAITKFTLKVGEPVASALNRLSRQAGLITVGDGAGGVTFAHPFGTLAPTAIDQRPTGIGRVKSGRLVEDSKDRFSTYQVVGQSDDDWLAQAQAKWGVEAGPPALGEAFDPGIPPDLPRLKVFLETQAADGDRLGRRALLEASTRAARSKSVRYVLAGWRTEDSWLWRKGYRVPVYDPRIAIGKEDGGSVELLLATVTRKLTATTGPTTEVTLIDPVAYTPIPLPPPINNIGLFELKDELGLTGEQLQELRDELQRTTEPPEPS